MFFIMIIVKIMARNCKYVVGRGRAGRMCHREVSESACRICVGLYVLLCVGGLSAALGFTSQSLAPPPGAAEMPSRAQCPCAPVCSAFVGVARMASAHLVTRDPRGPQGNPGTLDVLAVSLFQNTGCCRLSPRGGLKRKTTSLREKPLGQIFIRCRKLFVAPETSRQ